MNNLMMLFLMVAVILIAFYRYFKTQVFKWAPAMASKTNLIKHYPFSQVVGAIELSSIALLHALFCVAFALLCNVNITNVFFNTNFADCIYGALIGIGCVGISVLLCTMAMKFIEFYAKNNAPQSLHEWLAISGAGWIRHHKHTLKLFPFVISILIITLQIGSEETIFRSILMQLFEPYGAQTAFTISTFLFILMQAFHMPNMLSAMFPMIGAIVMGSIHGLLYLHHPSITPLIISHLTFFLFTIPNTHHTSKNEM